MTQRLRPRAAMKQSSENAHGSRQTASRVMRRAAEVRRPVHLRGASEELRFLLVMTRLDDRFVFEGSGAA